MRLNPDQIHAFHETLWDQYARFGRDLPWRQPDQAGRYDPYKIVVSELMLQQTQVPRVIPKYQQFLDALPTTASLAAVPLSLVLTLWSGLGYNRRAQYLQQAARTVTERYDGIWPSAAEELVRLPGIGPNTAGAIAAYAFNRPSLFVETNVRTVYIYHFLRDAGTVHDRLVLELLAATLDRQNPREFYWALMDYGSHLKSTVGNLNRVSSSYNRQTAFPGSRRQLRGQVIRLLTLKAYTVRDLRLTITDERLPDVLADLSREGMIIQRRGRYQLA